MHVNNARERINSAMSDCDGIKSGVHRFCGTEYKLGKREIGHVHGSYPVGFPFPLKIRIEILEKSLAEVHNALPESGWVSIYLRSGKDIERAIPLLKRSYALTRDKIQNKNHSF